ncbi:hypothetical protein J1N35_002321 [Gossypium stocksii]|uniref:Uncharacterized protein n=1 Tax=Gossypium stocksii TaxID=47602 RepID=A0A9D3WLI9_9ROSI|nr:hypothetical protein J1N35_002321 [Gossypium stocksii]
MELPFFIPYHYSPIPPLLPHHPSPYFHQLNFQILNIYLDNNLFTSIAPDAFSRLTSLQTLSLSKNTKLSPWTFSDLSQSTSLVEVQFDNTNLYGTLPDVFQSLNSLQSIRLSYNNLNDTLPPSLAGTMIQNLWINNQNVGFTGTLDVLSNMTNLLHVWVHKNMFTSQIPDLSKFVGIFDIKLKENLLTGSISRSLINLPSLKNISLSNNKLQNPFPKFPNIVENNVVNGTDNFCNNNGDPFDPQVTTLLEIAGGFGYLVQSLMVEKRGRGRDNQSRGKDGGEERER